MKKHYDSKYLNNAFNLAQQVKEDSYEYFKDLKNGSIIDLGCGTGKDAINIALNKNNSVLGIDHDENMIKIAKENLVNHNLDNLNFIVGQADDIKASDNSIDGFRSERVFQHLKNQQQVLNEIHRCLKPKGSLIIIETDWVNFTIYNQHYKLINKIQHYLASKKVKNGYSTRNLFSALPIAGFNIYQTKIYPMVISSLEEANSYFMIEKIIEEMKNLELLSKKEQSNLLDTLVELDKKNIFNLSINTLVIQAIKI